MQRGGLSFRVRHGDRAGGHIAQLDDPRFGTALPLKGFHDGRHSA